MVETTEEGIRIRSTVDVASQRTLLYACLAAGVWLLVALIIGAAGPNAHTRWTTPSFTCNETSGYIFGPGCDGINMALGAVKTVDFPPATEDYELSRTNFQFSQQVWPFNARYETQIESLRVPLKIQYTLYGTKNKDRTDLKMLFNRTSTHELLCTKHHPACYGFVLFLERKIDYPYYRLESKFLPSVGMEYVQNVDWTTSTQSLGFNNLQIAFRAIYFSITVLLIIAWCVPLRNLSLYEWPFEQRAVLLLLIGLLFFNNPFFGLQLSTNTWFWPFMDSFFQILFVTLLLVFWFVALARIRYSYTGVPPRRKWIFYSKLGLVAAYGVFAVILSYWLDIKFSRSSSLDSNFGGIIAIFYLTSTCFGAVLIWVIVGGVLNFPAAINHQPHFETRYTFLGLPASLVVISMLVGLFAGDLGPYNRNSVSFMYFFGLFNTYVYLLAFGFFPSVSDLGRGYVVDAEAVKMSDAGREQQSLMINNSPSESQEVSDENAARVLGSF